ncbi:MAG: hypothetical protein ABSA41_21715 [Terriglobia bacterium]|jgi:hypothetical protein
MQRNITIEEVRAEYVSLMGSDLGRLCYELQDDLEWLRYKWGEFLELFGKGPDRIELFSKVASNFFYFLQKLLYEDAMLHLCRLTDPPGNRCQENLTLLRLAKLIPEQEFSAQVRKDAEEVRKKCEFARKWRNKRLAHTDLMSLRNERASPLPSVTSQDVEGVLESMRALLNSVEQHYDIPPSALAHDPFGATSLVHFLEQVVRARENGDHRWIELDGHA